MRVFLFRVLSLVEFYIVVFDNMTDIFSIFHCW